MHTHACACIHAHILGGLDTFMVFDVKLSLPYKNTLECTNVNLLKASVECPVLHNFLMPNTVSKDGLKQLHIKICIHLSMAGSA